MVMAVCMHESLRTEWGLDRPFVWVAAMLRRAQERYEARRAAAALGRLSDEDLRDISLTRADAERILRHPCRSLEI